MKKVIKTGFVVALLLVSLAYAAAVNLKGSYDINVNEDPCSEAADKEGCMNSIIEGSVEKHLESELDKKRSALMDKCMNIAHGSDEAAMDTALEALN